MLLAGLNYTISRNLFLTDAPLGIKRMVGLKANGH